MSVYTLPDTERIPMQPVRQDNSPDMILVPAQRAGCPAAPFC